MLLAPMAAADRMAAIVLRLLVMSHSSPHADSSMTPLGTLLRWLAVVGFIYCLLVAVGMIGTGFKAAAGDSAKELFKFAANPFLGLLIGTLCTALIQSSSTVTSIIVGLVAGGMPVSVAVPMVMGANIGTTITNTLVSLGHVRNKDEFQRAFSAATVHDFFNLMAVLVFLPLEIAFGLLQKSSTFVLQWIAGGDAININGMNFIKPITKPVITLLQDALAVLPGMLAGVALAVLGVLIILISINVVGRLLKMLMVGKVKLFLHRMIGRGPLAGIASGTAVTVAVQSSSTTTSLMVPLVGTGVLTLREIYPFTLGANIGTTITALLAATAVVGDNAGLALQIALIHLLFNSAAVLLLFGLPLTRNIPLLLAERFSVLAANRKTLAIAYIVGVFFIAPGALVFVFR